MVPAPAADRLAVVALVLVVFHFAVPFFLLLSRAIKREPDMIVKVAIAILVARLIDLFWLIAPEFHQKASRSAGWTWCCR